MVWWWCIGCLFAAMSQLLDVTVFHVEANPRKMCSTPKKGQVGKQPIWGQLGFIKNTICTQDDYSLGCAIKDLWGFCANS